MIGYFFGWPHGQIWPNLAASGICAGLVWWRLHRHAVINHAELLVRQELGRRELRRHLAEGHDEIKRQLTLHCADLKAHVSAQAAAPGPGERM